METFIVRIWHPGDEASAAEPIRGLVRHVASGSERRFGDFEELRAFLTSANAVPPVDHPVGPAGDGRGCP